MKVVVSGRQIRLIFFDRLRLKLFLSSCVFVLTMMRIVFTNPFEASDSDVREDQLRHWGGGEIGSRRTPLPTALTENARRLEASFLKRIYFGVLSRICAGRLSSQISEMEMPSVRSKTPEARLRFIRARL